MVKNRETGRKNRKGKYRQPGGHYPFVRLVHGTGETYEAAKEFLLEVETAMEKTRLETERRREWLRKNVGSKSAEAVRTIEEFRRDPRYKGDGNRIDLAYAVYALSHGLCEDDVRRAIASRDLTKKGSLERQINYIDRTVRKAVGAIRGEERTR